MTDTNLREALTLAAVQIEEIVQMPYNRLTIDQAAKWAADARRAALAAAPQPAPADRKALVEAIREANDDWIASQSKPSSRPEFIADTLLARSLRLPGGEETMAWAVVGADGEIAVWSVKEDYEDAAEYEASGRVVRVAIRVVEGGDDAA